MDISGLFKRERKIDILISSILALIGIVLMIKPENTLNAIAIILGTITIIYGLYRLLNFIIKKEIIGELLYDNGLVIGIMSIICGLILIIYIGIIETVLRIIIGLWIVYNGIIKILEANIFKYTSLWPALIISSSISIALGLYITFYSGALITILGGIILTYSIIDIVQTVIYNKKEKKTP